MPTIDPRVDDYIAAAAPFAQPILVQVRDVVHAACPDAVETLKWRMPFFVYRGRNLLFMAAFKAHAGVGFWKGDAVAGVQEGADGMGQFGKLHAVADLPSRREMTRQVKAAMRLIDADPKAQPRPG